VVNILWRNLAEIRKSPGARFAFANEFEWQPWYVSCSDAIVAVAV
jgi:hypothetical protein